MWQQNNFQLEQVKVWHWKQQQHQPPPPPQKQQQKQHQQQQKHQNKTNLKIIGIISLVLNPYQQPLDWEKQFSNEGSLVPTHISTLYKTATGVWQVSIQVVHIGDVYISCDQI